MITLGTGMAVRADVGIPKPEHPTPDAARVHWKNLNGPWLFRFDPKDEGRPGGWSEPDAPGFDRTIVVPFGWESELSGIQRVDYRGVAWYRRTFRVPDDFPKDDRVRLHFGAVDWLADVWVNGRHVATHAGGYTPFSADVTEALRLSPGGTAVVTVRAFDPTDPSLPTGKQVGWYTPTSGIWQTVWLESHPKAHIERFQIKTTIDPARASLDVTLAGLPAGRSTVTIRSNDPTIAPVSEAVVANEGAAGSDVEGPGKARAVLTVPVEAPKLWSPETPHLYDVTLELKTPDGQADSVSTYFGLRTIARGRHGDAPFERLLLNGRPFYLRAALDQSFNPKGLYTAPDDAFLRHDIEIAKRVGLNGLRIHIKPDEPRRLYWADRLGMLILLDMPITWQQNARARQAWEKTMRETILRDRNHPSIVTWVAFNETWGLGHPEAYKTDRDTQLWVKSMVDAIRKLDSTRLVEDNSPCYYDHIANTDLNSWHFYIDDPAKAREHIADVVARTEPGSGFNYCPGEVQTTAPLINSEYGGVSAGGGDRDVSWSFRDLTTQLRRHRKIQGYVYTELADIEWEHNGFVNYDRTPKKFGYEAFVPGMSLSELQGADFIGYDAPPVIVAKPGEVITVPLFVSHFSDRKGPAKLHWWVSGVGDGADLVMAAEPESRPVEWTPYDVRQLEPVKARMPMRPFVGAFVLTLRDEDDRRIAANYVNVVVKPDRPVPRIERQGDREAVLRFAPGTFAGSKWTGPVARPMGKAHGQGKGFFEYRLMIPEAIAKARPEAYELRLEVASKAGRQRLDWPLRISKLDNPQTDERTWPSTIEIAINGHVTDRLPLADDPADARGVLSHLARVEHGSYGELIKSQGALPGAVQEGLADGNPLVLRLAVPEDADPAGGLSLFGAEAGQYPFDPTLVIHTKDRLPDELGEIRSGGASGAATTESKPR